MKWRIERVFGGFLFFLFWEGPSLTLPPAVGWGLGAAFLPTHLTSGTHDRLLSDTVRMHAALRAAGVEADIYVAEAMPHAGFGRQTLEDRAVQNDSQWPIAECRLSASPWQKLSYDDLNPSVRHTATFRVIDPETGCFDELPYVVVSRIDIKRVVRIGSHCFKHSEQPIFL